MENKATSQRTQAYWIMTTPVQTVRMVDTLREVASLFNEKNISAAAVLDGHERPVGVISKTDLIRYEQERDVVARFNKRPAVQLVEAGPRAGVQPIHDQDTVARWMTPVILSVKPETPMKEIARQMVKYGVHHMFVKGRNGEPLVGIVSSFDILKQVALPEVDTDEQHN